MKKQLQTVLPIYLMFSFTFLLGCSAESELDDDDDCACEKVTYIEAKYLEETTETWLLSYSETDREDVDCQEETNYSVPPTGSEVREVYRIECN